MRAIFIYKVFEDTTPQWSDRNRAKQIWFIYIDKFALSTSNSLTYNKVLNLFW